MITNHKDARAMFDPSPPLRLIWDADQEVKKLSQLNIQLSEVGSAIAMHRQLLESTMTPAQREVFADYVAETFLRDQLVMMIEIQMRALAQRRGQK